LEDNFDDIVKNKTSLKENGKEINLWLIVNQPKQKARASNSEVVANGAYSEF